MRPPRAISAAGRFNPSLSTYGFVDFYGKRDQKFNLSTYYGEVRIMQSPGFAPPSLQKWNLTFEANGGTDYDGIGRFDVVWNTSLGKGHAFALKLYPVATRDHDAQAAFFISQGFTPEISDFWFSTTAFALGSSGRNKSTSKPSCSTGSPNGFRFSPKVATSSPPPASGSISPPLSA